MIPVIAPAKKTVLVMFGGRSPEHDISIVTGLQVLKAIDPAHYNAIPLYIAPNGQWLTGEALRDRTTYIPGPSELARLTPVTLHIGPAKRPCLKATKTSLFKSRQVVEFDIAALAFHGLIGEDGQIQGLLEAANIPYTGMRTMASSVLMDKAATKRMLKGTFVPLLLHKEIRRPKEGLLITPDELATRLGDVKFPCCVKPAHLGSSIGVAKVHDFTELSDTLPAIFRFDDLAILEPFVDNLVEYNVAVRRDSDGTIVTSAIERPKHSSDLLDFKAKYLSGGNKKLGGSKAPEQSSQGMLSLTRDINPAIPSAMEQNIRAWARTVFEQVGGTGAPRLDFLSNAATGEVWFNEANPCPGSFGYFLWEAAAKPVLFTELLDALLSEAFAKHRAAQIPADPTPEAARLFKRRK